MSRSKWIYFSSQTIQQNENRLTIPSDIRDNLFLKPGMDIEWGYDEGVGHLVWPVAEEDEIWSDREKPVILSQTKGFEVYSSWRLTIPKEYIEVNEEEARARFGDHGFYHGEKRFFVAPVERESDSLVYILSEDQLEQAVQDPSNWVDSGQNQLRLRNDKRQIPNHLLPPEIEIVKETGKEGAISTASNDGIDILPDKLSVDERVRKDIRQLDCESLYVLQYSSQKVDEIITTALEEGLSVSVLVRHPDPDIKWSVTKSQSEQIKSQIQSLIDTVIDLMTSNTQEVNLNLQFYFQQAGLRALRLDDSRVYAGWYTFENRNSKLRDPYRKHVQGHNNPMIAISGEADNFKSVSEMFERSFYSLWKQGTSLQQIFNDGQWGELTDWIEIKRGREQAIKEVSGKAADELFEQKSWMDDIEQIEDSSFY